LNEVSLQNAMTLLFETKNPDILKVHYFRAVGTQGALKGGDPLLGWIST
jgi:hypothetical protein